jgi:hypothetical protein
VRFKNNTYVRSACLKTLADRFAKGGYTDWTSGYGFHIKIQWVRNGRMSPILLSPVQLCSITVIVLPFWLSVLSCCSLLLNCIRSDVPFGWKTNSSSCYVFVVGVLDGTHRNKWVAVKVRVREGRLFGSGQCGSQPSLKAFTSRILKTPSGRIEWPVAMDSLTGLPWARSVPLKPLRPMAGNFIWSSRSSFFPDQQTLKLRWAPFLETFFFF